MKINLYLDPSDLEHGYTNIEGTMNLDDWAENAEANSIRALNVINHIPLHTIPELIKHWLIKLARGGTIEIGGLSFEEIGRKIYRGDVDLEKINSLLYGYVPDSSSPNLPRRSVTSLAWVEAFLKKHGLIILQKRIDDLTNSYYIKAGRS